MTIRRAGDTFSYRYATLDADGADATAITFDFCMRKVGSAVDAVAYDELDTTETTIAAGYVDVVIPAATTAAFVAGIYCLEFSWAFAGGTASAEARTETVRVGCC